jgi:hypothetical protein
MLSNCAEAADLREVLSSPHVPAIRLMLSQIRPGLSEDSVTFRSAVLLLTGPGVAFNVDRMACRTQIPRAIVSACTRRLFDNGVWHPDGPVYAWHSPDDDQFWNDVSVAEGKLCRRTDRLGRIEWASPGAWQKRYDFGSTESESLCVNYHSQVEQKGPAAAEIPVQEEVASEAEVRIRRPKAAVRPEPMMVSVVPDTPSTWLGETQPAELFPGTSWLI